jgi:glycosyltransferase involved in cell wall biosynthesis
MLGNITTCRVGALVVKAILQYPSSVIASDTGSLMHRIQAFWQIVKWAFRKKQNRRKLLYVCGTYAPGAFAGSELSAHELLRELSHNYFIDVTVVTDQRYTGGRPGRELYQSVPIVGLAHEKRSEGISQIIDEFRPNAILTQLLWSDVALSVGRDKGIPTIFRLPSVPTNIDLTLPTAIVANSRFSKEWVRSSCGRESDLVFPTIDLTRVLSGANLGNRRLITMFNPIDVKGGWIFHEIARAMPSRRFAVVPGWHSLRKANGDWDENVLRRSLESQRASFDWRPKDISFLDLGNVEILPPREKVSEIYAQTRILVVPSQWEETLARVSIEALANGIPVIGSAVGGLQDHVAAAGILVKDKQNIDAWVSAIESLDDPALYAEYSRKGPSFVKREHSAERTARDFLAVFERVIKGSGNFS